MIGASRSVLTTRIALGRLAADDVLDRPADPAGDVQVRRDPRPGLADLHRVGSPAGARHDPRDADGAPSSAASSSKSAKPSLLPTPRPPPTTTRASASEIRAGLGRDSGDHPGAEVRRSTTSGLSVSTRTATGVAVGSGSTTCSAMVRKRTGPSRVASSSRLPAQRWRVSRNGSPGVHLDAIGGHRAAGEGGRIGHDFVAPIGPGAP